MRWLAGVMRDKLDEVLSRTILRVDRAFKDWKLSGRSVDSSKALAGRRQSKDSWNVRAVKEYVCDDFGGLEF